MRSRERRIVGRSVVALAAACLVSCGGGSSGSPRTWVAPTGVEPAGTPPTGASSAVPPVNLRQPVNLNAINLTGVITPFGVVRSSLDRGGVGHPGIDRVPVLPTRHGRPRGPRAWVLRAADKTRGGVDAAVHRQRRATRSAAATPTRPSGCGGVGLAVLRRLAAGPTVLATRPTRILGRAPSARHPVPAPRRPRPPAEDSPRRAAGRRRGP